jgi:hypothetical protein
MGIHESKKKVVACPHDLGFIADCHPLGGLPRICPEPIYLFFILIHENGILQSPFFDRCIGRGMPGLLVPVPDRLFDLGLLYSTGYWSSFSMAG